MEENNLEWPTAWTGDKEIPYEDTQIIINEFTHPVRNKKKERKKKRKKKRKKERKKKRKKERK